MTQTTPLRELSQAGQSPWLDNISRELLRSGKLKSLIEDQGLLGVTSNPTIFEKAIGKSASGGAVVADGGYEADIERLLAKGAGTFEIYDALTIADIQETCDLFRGVFAESKGEHGFVSLEVLPSLAHDEEVTVAEALRLFKAVNRPNCMIKVPATPEGIPAVRRLIGSGVNINITLMFSLKHYRDVANAYLDGLQDFLKKGGDLRRVHSVASIFVSRIDTLIDKKLQDEDLKGKAAVANSRLIYQEFKKIFGSEKFHSLQTKGAWTQKVLWGSTSAKNPSYPDLIYVENLIGRETVNTMPDATLEAFLDHGKVPGATIEEELKEAEATVRQLKSQGIDLLEVGEVLQHEGVKSFAQSFDSLMRTLELRREALSGAGRKSSSYAGLKVKNLGRLESAVHSRITFLEKEKFQSQFMKGDPSLWKKDASHHKVILNRLGWLRVADWALGKLHEMDSLAAEIKKEKIRDIVLLGMGGSSLASEVLSFVFKDKKGPRFHVLDTTDAASILKVEKSISLKSSLFIVSSKSGSTIETFSQYRYFYDRVATGRHFVAITDEGSALEKEASARHFRRVFINPSDIGGRYSALSFFGLVPASLMGIDVRSILRSARQFFQATELEKSLLKNPGIYLGILLGEFAKKGKDKVTFWMTKSLTSFGVWVEQLIAESTGKDGKGIVPVDGEEPGDADAYGSDRLFVVMKLKGDKSDVLSQREKAITQAGFPVIELEWPDPASIGAEFLRWEIATTVAGALLDVNPFDEPNVQESKDNTSRLLKEAEKSGKLPRLKDSAGDARALAGFFSKIKKGSYVALLAYTERSPEATRAFNRIRKKIRDRFHVPTVLGFGPRYLHSAGQLFKGGRRSGLFLEFHASAAKDIKIPGAAFGFNQLKLAQAIGDFQAFSKRGIPVLYIELGGKAVPALAAFEKKLDTLLAPASGKSKRKGKKMPKK